MSYGGSNQLEDSAKRDSREFPAILRMIDPRRPLVLGNSLHWARLPASMFALSCVECQGEFT
jgi:hypothetical protein